MRPILGPMVSGVTAAGKGPFWGGWGPCWSGYRCCARRACSCWGSCGASWHHTGDLGITGRELLYIVMASRTMSLFRIVDRDGELRANADSLDGVTEIVRHSLPGCYHIDEISAEPLPSGNTARRWGFAFRHDDGRVILDPDPKEV